MLRMHCSQVKVSIIFALLCLLNLPLANAQNSLIFLDQGSEWTEERRQRYYTQDQGSQIIPLRWIVALDHDGKPFMDQHLNRYGYLANPNSEFPSLPVGFTVAKGDSGRVLGMTCAACHTRQIIVDGKQYRADGGPAIVDFQSFLSDLKQAVEHVIEDDNAFNTFAQRVLGPSPSEGEKQQLNNELQQWFLPYSTLIERSLPTPAWGPSRLDAVSMIFNRLAGLDLGEPPTYLIPENIQVANAPVRYPFLWNAARQDFTQWPGFASNGNFIFGLSRNLGEVFGVFADFRPIRDDSRILGINYLHKNSANFHGLTELEQLIWKIGPPQWPWAIDQDLAEQGYTIFSRPTAQGGCVECHGIKPGQFRSLTHQDKIWATPLLDVGTDSLEHHILERTVKTGVLEGANIPLLKSQGLKAEDTAFNVLGLAVIGSILQHYNPLDRWENHLVSDIENELGINHKLNKHLANAFRKPVEVVQLQQANSNNSVQKYPYESRVLEGIWAAAPYLHNGSVPTLAELLKPAEQRISQFKIGPNYDIENIGLATEQTHFDYTLNTTDCSKRNSGNSRCGHEFGTNLSPAEKDALLEYLKTL